MVNKIPYNISIFIMKYPKKIMKINVQNKAMPGIKQETVGDVQPTSRLCGLQSNQLGLD